MSDRIYLFLTTCCVVFALSASSTNAVELPSTESQKSAAAVAEKSEKSENPVPPGTVAAEPAVPAAPVKEDIPPGPGEVAAKPEGESAVQGPAASSDNPPTSPSAAPGTESDTSSPAPNVRIINEANPAPPDTGPPEYRKAQFRLSGSMCYSCLNTLKRKLLQVYGVQAMRVDKPVHNLFQPYAPDVSSWAEAIIVYDQHKVALTDVRAFMRSNGYMSYKVVDKVFTDSLDSIKEKERK